MPSYLLNKRGDRFAEFELEVQMGKVDGARIEWHMGTTDTNASGVESTVCHRSTGLYVYNLGYGVEAGTISLISDTPADNGILIKIAGLNADGEEQSETVAIGATSLKTWSRFFGGMNIDNREFIGLLDAVKTIGALPVGFFNAKDQCTTCGRYTVPKGKVGFLTAGELSLGQGKEVKALFKVRRQGGVFITAQKVAMYQNSFRAERPRNFLPELTDLEARIIPTSNDVSFSVTFGIIVLDKKIHNLEGL